MDPELLELMPALVMVRRYTGTDDFGNPAFGSPEQWQCRIETNRRRTGVLGQGGTVHVTTLTETTLIGPYVEPAWGPDDRFTLPTGAVMTVSDANDVETDWDENGPYSLTVTLTSTKEK